jgi:hypothetical protein
MQAKDCPPGEERYEEYYSNATGTKFVQYDYRTPEGKLFSTIRKSLEACRRERDLWLERRKYGH